MNLLLIDHNPNSLMAYKNVFELWGFQVTPCSSGSELRDLFPDSSFDAVITELDLPGAERGKLVPYLRKKLPNRPLIVFTENYSVQSAIQAIRNGADDYILKPFDLERLKELIFKHIERKVTEGEQKIPYELENLASSLQLNINRAIAYMQEKQNYVQFLEVLHRVSFEHISDAILMLDEEGCVLAINERMRELLGIAAAELSGQPLFEQLPALKNSFLFSWHADPHKQNGEYFLHNEVFVRPSDHAAFQLEGKIATITVSVPRKRFTGIICVINRFQQLTGSEKGLK